jgi:hypothetical protein
MTVLKEADVAGARHEVESCGALRVAVRPILRRRTLMVEPCIVALTVPLPDGDCKE